MMKNPNIIELSDQEQDYLKTLIQAHVEHFEGSLTDYGQFVTRVGGAILRKIEETRSGTPQPHEGARV